VLWIDAGCYVKKSLDAHWDIIEKQGYYIQLNGWTSGDWTTDRCLEIMGVSREEAFKMPHAMANVMGFDFTNPICTECFDKWLDYSKNKEVFSGPWKNDKGSCSKDSRVLGHRHDQSVIGILAAQMGLNFTDSVGKGLLSYGKDDKEGYVIIATGV